MHRNTLVFVLLGIVGGFVGGFILANSINRSELTAMRSQTEQSKSTTTQPGNSTDDSLSSEEIRAKIATADKNPGDFAYQKNLGVSLYRYAAMKQDVELLGESARILTRANGLDAKDYEVLVALGNAHFDIGFNKKDAASFGLARTVYAKALAQKPDDSDVRTDLGLTYFLQEPAALDQAAAELQRVINANPKHDRALQFLVQIYVKQSKLADAQRTLSRIIEINPSNPAIADLRSQIMSAESGSK